VRVVLSLQKLGGRLDKVHILSRSQAALTGMRAANLVLGNVVAHASRQAFDAAIAEAIRARTG